MHLPIGHATIRPKNPTEERVGVDNPGAAEDLPLELAYRGGAIVLRVAVVRSATEWQVGAGRLRRGPQGMAGQRCCGRVVC